MNLLTLILILNLTSFLLIRFQLPEHLIKPLTFFFEAILGAALLIYLPAHYQRLKTTPAFNSLMSVDLNNRQPLRSRAGKGRPNMLEDP